VLALKRPSREAKDKENAPGAAAGAKAGGDASGSSSAATTPGKAAAGARAQAGPRWGLADIAGHTSLDASFLTHYTRVQNALEDVASNVCQTLLRGCGSTRT
jgi:hypothetical protein